MNDAPPPPRRIPPPPRPGRRPLPPSQPTAHRTPPPARPVGHRATPAAASGAPSGNGSWFGRLSLGKKFGAVGAAAILSVGLVNGVAGAIGDNSSSSGGGDRAPIASSSPTPTVAEPVVEVREETVTEAVPFTSSTVDDGAAAAGSTTVRVAGVAGELTRTFEVTYTDGVETGRVEVSALVTTPAVNEVVARGTKTAPKPAPVAPAPPPAATNCPNGSYTNSAGNSVCRPHESAGAPAGATAQCKDGTWSHSQNRSGTCSGHGGVARWL